MEDRKEFVNLVTVACSSVQKNEQGTIVIPLTLTTENGSIANFYLRKDSDGVFLHPLTNLSEEARMKLGDLIYSYLEQIYTTSRLWNATVVSLPDFVETVAKPSVDFVQGTEMVHSSEDGHVFTVGFTRVEPYQMGICILGRENESVHITDFNPQDPDTVKVAIEDIERLEVFMDSFKQRLLQLKKEHDGSTGQTAQQV